MKHSEPLTFSDPSDRATQEEELERQRSLERHKAEAAGAYVPPPKGFCHYCDEKVLQDKLFCDRHCADDYAYEQKRRQINRKV